MPKSAEASGLIKTNNMEKILQECPFFKGINEAGISELLDKYPHRVRSFEEGEFVVLQNDVCDNLMIVIRGLVQAQMVDPTGKQIIIEELGTGQLLAPAFIFPNVNRMPVSVYVLQPAEVLYFRRQVLLQMMQENQALLVNFLAMISNRSRFLSEKLKFHAFMSIKDKIAHYLLKEQAEQQSPLIRLRHTQQELADMFGIARPSLARAMAEMEKAGLIRAKNKEVEIVDIKRLSSYIKNPQM